MLTPCLRRSGRPRKGNEEKMGRGGRTYRHAGAKDIDSNLSTLALPIRHRHHEALILKPVRHASLRLKLVDVDGAWAGDSAKDGLHLRVELGPAAPNGQSHLLVTHRSG